MCPSSATCCCVTFLIRGLCRTDCITCGEYRAAGLRHDLCCAPLPGQPPYHRCTHHSCFSYCLCPGAAASPAVHVQAWMACTVLLRCCLSQPPRSCCMASAVSQPFIVVCRCCGALLFVLLPLTWCGSPFVWFIILHSVAGSKPE